MMREACADSRFAKDAPLAQRIERLATDQEIGGSNPPGGTIRLAAARSWPALRRFCWLRAGQKTLGRVECPEGAK